ncbi:MAG: hypothetical protein K2X47_14610, partial [Bdellovibrionales bacterium]|nr:hypothetical protein [Bdellovibrionales bacterium]
MRFKDPFCFVVLMLLWSSLSLAEQFKNCTKLKGGGGVPKNVVKVQCSFHDAGRSLTTHTLVTGYVSKEHLKAVVGDADPGFSISASELYDVLRSQEFGRAKLFDQESEF